MRSATSKARQQLHDRGQVGLRPGQGGQIVLKPRISPKQAKREQATDGWPETRLMPWLKKYLDGPIQSELDVLRGAQCLTCDTSSVGRPGVQWARPDFTMISVKQFKLLPGVEFDVHSFELKTESGGATDLAVFEALAQTRFTNFGYLVWHLPDGFEVREEAAQHREAMQPARDRIYPRARTAGIRDLDHSRRPCPEIHAGGRNRHVSR